MKKLWAEDETMRVIADAQVDATKPDTNHAAAVARMAEEARRFALPSDPDPVLTRIEEAPVDSGSTRSGGERP